MEEHSDLIATMTIDLKRSRFRIHRATIRALGDPAYLQFLVNPEELFIAVMGTDKPLTGGTANRINTFALEKSKSIEFYSASLLERINTVMSAIDYRYSYRLSGEIDKTNRVAYFSMTTLQRVKRSIRNVGEGI